MDSSPPVSSVHEISQARTLEWVAISFSRGSSQPRDQTCLLHWLGSPQEEQEALQFSSVQSRSRVRLCDPMGCSTPGFPVHHQLLELAQTHVCCVGGAIQPSHPLSFHSPPAFNLSKHQGLFQGVSSSHQVSKLL